MEEQREESEFVVDGCIELMEEAAGKGLGLSSRTETLDGDDAKTLLEVLVVDSGVCDVSVTHENSNGGGSVSGDGNTDFDVKQVKVGVGSVEKTVCSEICVSETVVLAEVEMKDEANMSEIKSNNGGEIHGIAGEEESVISSGGNEVSDEKEICEFEDSGGACDHETLSVAEDKAESAEKIHEGFDRMDVDSKQTNEENVALTKQNGSETKDARHSESAEESTRLSKGDGNKGNPGTVLEVSSAGGICSEEEITNVNQKDEKGEAMEIDYAAEEHVEKDIKVGGFLDYAGNESADSVIFFRNTSQKTGNEVQNSKKRGENMKPIPADIITEIFSRLPAKSVGRFRSLSKLWCSTLSRSDFIELFLSRSCARPRLLFAVERKGVWKFFSSPQSLSSLVVTADYHTTFYEDISRFTCSYASGLFYFRDLWNPRVGQLYVVCNPVTGQYVTLPNMSMYRKSRGFLGFDPVEKKFKVLAEGHPFCSQRDHHEVLTLGTGEISWRKEKNDCPQYDSSLCEGICINGVLYYLVDNFSETPGNIVRFDLSSEEFRFVVAECFADLKTTKLINYKGKLGGIDCIYGEAGGRFTLELRLCVLEDVERSEWSTYAYTLPENELIDDPSTVSVAGVIGTGEIVLAMDYTCKPYYVFYFNPERNTLRSVEIQGFGADLEALEYRGRVSASVDHVEHLDVEDFKHCRAKLTCTSCEGCVQDLNIVDSKQLGSSIFANQVKRFCSNCEEQEKRQ